MHSESASDSESGSDKNELQDEMCSSAILRNYSIQKVALPKIYGQSIYFDSSTKKINLCEIQNNIFCAQSS